jgi:hypothetical protein
MKSEPFWVLITHPSERALRFGDNILPQFSGLESKLSKNPAKIGGKLIALACFTNIPLFRAIKFFDSV